jgi:hypothetical protein
VDPFVFEWDDANADHVARHGFSPDEVEEVFAGRYKVMRSRDGRYVAFGATFDGRLAYVVYERKPSHVLRVVTARDMKQKERRLYRRK